MAANQTTCSLFEQRSVIKVLMAEKSKTCKIYRLCDFTKKCLQMVKMQSVRKDRNRSGNTLTLRQRKVSGVSVSREVYHIYQPLRSGRIGHKVNF